MKLGTIVTCHVTVSSVSGCRCPDVKHFAGVRCHSNETKLVDRKFFSVASATEQNV